MRHLQNDCPGECPGLGGYLLRPSAAECQASGFGRWLAGSLLYVLGLLEANSLNDASVLPPAVPQRHLPPRRIDRLVGGPAEFVLLASDLLPAALVGGDRHRVGSVGRGRLTANGPIPPHRATASMDILASDAIR
jgi:hypothetical protein